MATNDIVLLVILGIFFLGGLISGFIKSSSKIFSLAGGAVLSFYLGGVVSGLLIKKVEAVTNFVNENSFGSSLVLVGSYAGIFLIGFLVILLLTKALSKILNSNGIGKFFDKLLGAAAGIAIGFVICDVYVWALYGFSCANAEIATWVLNDAKLNLEGFQTFTKWLMEFNLNAIGEVFPGLM